MKLKDKIRKKVIRWLKIEESAFSISKPIIDGSQYVKLSNNFQQSTSHYLGDYQSLTKLYDGTKVFLDTRDISVTPHLILTGEWEMDITHHWMKIVEEIKPKCVFDVGANSGYFGLLAASKEKDTQVHYFEANPRLADLIRRSTALNGFSNRSFIVNRGVSDHSGEELTLTIPGGYFGSASFHQGLVDAMDQHVDQSSLETISVQTISLDDYSNKINIVPSLVKIDIEGYEEHLMRGARSLFSNDMPQVVFLEYMPGAYTKDFIPLISKLFKKYYLIEGYQLRELKNLTEIGTRVDWSMLILRK
jgi:FkbM family methyltransferase